jgi:hypothetical protein
VNETSRRTVQHTVRVQIWGGGESFIVTGNLPVNPPKDFEIKKLPELLQERINVLKMLDASQEIKYYGKKSVRDVYYIYITQEEWETLQPNLIKESI